MSKRVKGKSGGIYFKVTDEERKLIEQRMALMGVRNMSAYIRKMCIDGYIVQLQIKELDECAKLLRYTSNNVNQIARRVNSDGGVYPDEVDEITSDLANKIGKHAFIVCTHIDKHHIHSHIVFNSIALDCTRKF